MDAEAQMAREAEAQMEEGMEDSTRARSSPVMGDDSEGSMEPKRKDEKENNSSP
jgi:hypothetical protein